MKLIPRVCLATAIVLAVSCLAFDAQASIHPCVPTTLKELDTITANLK